MRSHIEHNHKDVLSEDAIHRYHLHADKKTISQSETPEPEDIPTSQPTHVTMPSPLSLSQPISSNPPSFDPTPPESPPSVSPKSTLHDDVDLLTIGMQVNTQFHVPICASCHIAIEPKNMAGHAADHGYPSLSSLKLEALKKKYNLVGTKEVELPTTLIPVEGLKIYDGFCCTKPDCNRAAGTARTIVSHLRMDHHETFSESEIPACKMQRFYEFYDQKCWRVHPQADPVMYENTEWAAFLRQAEEEDLKGAKTRIVPRTERDLDIWSYTTRWHETIHPPCNVKIVFNLAATPNEEIEPWLTRLVDATQAYYTDIANNKIHLLTELVRKLILTARFSKE